MTRGRVVGIAVLVVLAVLAWPRLAPRVKAPAPSIVLISIDTLRPDHLGCYGYARRTSPNIDRFASEAALFENGYAHAPMTGPSCASFLSGFLPHETRALGNRSRVADDVVTVAEILRAGGYETYAVVCNYVLREGQGFEQGFDVYDAKMDEVELVRDHPERIAEKATSRAIEILGANGGERFFLWVHYQDPHGPYTPPAPYDTLFPSEGGAPRPLPFGEDVKGKGAIPTYQRLGDHTDYRHYVSQYDGEIRYLDEQIGRLFGTLRDLGVYERGLVLLTADHGEALGESDYFFAHGHNLDECLIRVPLLVKHPAVAPGRRPEVAQHMDIVPTILDVAGAKSMLPYRGRSLLAARAGEPAVFSELRMKSHAVIVDSLKLVMDGDGASHLFDLRSDPAGTVDLAAEPSWSARLRELAEILRRMKDEDLLGVREDATEKPLSEEEAERLRSLGYVE